MRLRFIAMDCKISYLQFWPILKRAREKETADRDLRNVLAHAGL